MVLLVNYNDPVWVATFIMEVLTDEDFIEITNSDIGRLTLAKKMGYKSVSDTYVFHNQDGEIEEDYNMKKLIRFIESNELYDTRFIKTVKNTINT